MNYWPAFYDTLCVVGAFIFGALACCMVVIALDEEDFAPLVLGLAFLVAACACVAGVVTINGLPS